MVAVYFVTRASFGGEYLDDFVFRHFVFNRTSVCSVCLTFCLYVFKYVIVVGELIDFNTIHSENVIIV